ncbi:hypothetical protein [Sphingomonas soli]|uniref:hypothetical protein n=1 Tax=Sphingomonas soli TaxID=266127 RepID=UPI000837815C|nr:hypothetical protein [Sphingomonas soli]
MRKLLIVAALFSCGVATQSSAQAARITEDVICTAEVRQTTGWRLTETKFYTDVYKVVWKPKMYDEMTASWKARLAREGYTQTPGTYAGCHTYTAGAPIGGNIAPNPTKLDWSPPPGFLP